MSKADEELHTWLAEPPYKIVKAYGDGLLVIQAEFESLREAREAFKKVNQNKHYLIKALG